MISFILVYFVFYLRENERESAGRKAQTESGRKRFPSRLCTVREEPTWGLNS